MAGKYLSLMVHLFGAPQNANPGLPTIGMTIFTNSLVAYFERRTQAFLPPAGLVITFICMPLCPLRSRWLRWSMRQKQIHRGGFMRSFAIERDLPGRKAMARSPMVIRNWTRLFDTSSIKKTITAVALFGTSI